MKLVSILCLLGSLLINNSAVVASASRYTQVAKIDTTDPLDDLLQDSEFKTYYDLGSYNYRTDVLNVDCELLRLYEYNYDDNYNNDFSLYVYIFNPLEDREFFTTDMRNNLQFSLKEYDENYKKYNLEFISKHENRFFKFKVSLDNNLYNKLDPSERTYNVSGFELVTVGNSNATDYPVDKSFIFTGLSDDNNLECNVTGLETIHLDVNDGYYRTDALNENGCQTDIFYVYFSIPNKYINDYGDLVKIHAEYNKYNLDDLWIINEEYIDFKKATLDTIYSITTPNSDLKVITGITGVPSLDQNKVFSVEDSSSVVPKEELASRINELGIDYYSSTSVEESYYNVNIGNFDDDGTDNRYDILSYEDTHSGWNNFWAKVFGKNIEESFNNIPVIQELGIDVNVNYKEYYINENDKENIVNFCNNERLNYKTPYIFRFALADYFSGSFRCVYQDVVDNITYTFTEYLGYCVQENSVIQNFDIIDLTFEKNGRQSIIPVVADPIDIYTDITPPPSVDNDWWEKLIKLLLLLILIFIVIPFIIRLINWFSNVFRFNKSNKSIKKKRKKRK